MLVPTMLNLGALAGDVKVIDISAGAGHSLVVCHDGSVVAFGGDDPVVLGLGEKGDPKTPTPFTGRATRRAAIEAQYYATPIKVPVPTDVKITCASAGRMHSLLVADDGRVLSFGIGKGGALGHGEDEGDKAIPAVIDALSGVDVRVAAAGATHSLVVSEAGAVFEFGHEHAQADMWDDDDDDDDDPDAPPRPTQPRGLPTLIGERGDYGWSSRAEEAFLDGVIATEIAAGFGTTAIRTAAGLASFGGHENDTDLEWRKSEWPTAEEAANIEKTIADQESKTQKETVLARLAEMDGAGGCVVA